MNLKESFELSNYLNSLLTRTTELLYNPNNITTTTQKLLRSKSNPEATDEVIEVKKNFKLDCDNITLVDFAVDVMGEISALSDVITAEKLKCNYDAMISNNKKERHLLDALNYMISVKPSESTAEGSAFKLDVDGRQVQYIYDIEQVTTIDFDRKTVKAIAKKITDETRKRSNLIDKYNLECEVNFTSKYEIDESLEDAIERFIKSRNSEQ